MADLSFNVREATTAPSKVTLLKWSPNHQLLALVFETLPLTLYRLPWERVWGCRMESAPRALCWSPSGAFLLVGMEDGSLVALDKETGVVLFRDRLTVSVGINNVGPTDVGSTTSAIVSLTWCPFDKKQDPNEFEMDLALFQAFPPIPTEFPKNTTDPVAILEDVVKQTTFPSRPSKEDENWENGVVSVGFDNGSVSLLLSGRVALAQIPSGRESNPLDQNVIICQATLLRDFCSLVVVRQTHSDGLRSPSPHNALELIVYDCQALGSHYHDISSIAEILYHISVLFKDCSKCLEYMYTKWSVMLRAYQTILRMEGYSREELAQDLFIYFALLAAPPKLFERIAKTKWSKPWLTKTAHQLDAALHGISDVINRRLRMQLRKALILVTHLRESMGSRFPYKNDTIDLHSTDFEQLEFRILWLLIRLEQIYNEIRKEASNYRTLLDALSFVNESITNQTEIDNPNFKDQFRLVLSFYAGEFPSEKLLPEFESHPCESVLFQNVRNNEPIFDLAFLTTLSGEELEKVLKTFYKFPEYYWKKYLHVLKSYLKTKYVIRERDLRKGLRNQLSAVSNYVNEALWLIRNSLSQEITWIQKVNLSRDVPREISVTDLRYAIDVTNDDHFLFAYGLRNPRDRELIDGIVICKGNIMIDDGEKQIILRSSLVKLLSDMNLIDLKFWRKDHLVCVMTSNAFEQSEIVSFVIDQLKFGEQLKFRRSRVSTDDLQVGHQPYVTLDSIEKRQRSHSYGIIHRPIDVTHEGLAAIVSDIKVMIYDLTMNQTHP